MAGAGLRIAIDDEDTVQVLGLLERRLDDPEPALEEIGSRLVLSTQLRFERQHDPDGVPWKPSLRAQKQKGQTLVDTARLLKSITHIVRSNAVEVGTNVVYASAHQFGLRIRQAARTAVLAFRPKGGKFASRKSTRRRKRGAVPIAFAQHGPRTVQMPVRAFLGLDARDRQAILRIVGTWLNRS